MSIQIINDPRHLSSTLGGRLGQGISEGLSQQLPKELENARLSKGARSLEERGLLPKGSSEILGLPGGRELYSQIAPTLQSQSQREQRKTLREEPKKPSLTQQVPLEEKTKTTNAQQKTNKHPEELMPSKRLASQEETRAFKNRFLQQPSNEDIESITDKYLDAYPQMPLSEARQMATNELNQNLQAQQTQRASLKSDLNERMSRELQSGGLGDFTKIYGELQNRLLDEAEMDVIDRGMTPEAASEKAVKSAFDLARTLNQSKKLGGISLLQNGAKSQISALKKQKKTFDDYGLPDRIFLEAAAANTGWTPMAIANALDPIKNEKMTSILDSKSFKSQSPSIRQKLSDKQFNEIKDNLKNTDNLLSIAYKLREKGFSVEDFAQRMDAFYDKLSDDQKFQLQQAPSSSMYGDILLKAFGG